MYTSCWAVVGLALSLTLLQEAVNWVLIYRTSAYRGVKETLERATKRLDNIRATTTGNEKQLKKKEKHMDGVMKSAQKDLAMIKMKSGAVTGLLLFAGYKLVGAQFDGVVVGKLPFEPFNMFHALTHRGLAGVDFTDCSMAFLYAMCASGIRLNISKLIGDVFGVSFPRSMKQANPFFAPTTMKMD